MAKKFIALSIICFFFAGTALSQPPQISYLRVDEFPTGSLYIIGRFDLSPGLVRMNGFPLSVNSWTDTEIICNIDDSTYDGGIVTVINGMDSAQELLSFWKLHVDWNDVWQEGSEGDNQTVAWDLGFRVDLQALIDNRLSSVELQPTRRSKCNYSIMRNASAVLSYHGFGTVPCKSASDTTHGASFSVKFDVYSNLHTALLLGNVSGYPMIADTGYWNPQPISYEAYSFDATYFHNLSPEIDSSYSIRPYENVSWMKFGQPQTWMEWRSDAALFLPPISKASVTQSDSRASAWLVNVPGTFEYLFRATSRTHEMEIYSSIGQLIQKIEIQPNTSSVFLPQLPAGLYFVRLDKLVSKVVY